LTTDSGHLYSNIMPGKSGGFIQVVLIFIVVALIGVAAYWYFFSNKNQNSANLNSKPIIVGFSLGTLQEERWQRDRDEFVKGAKSMNNVSVIVEASNNNSATQVSQIKGMITKGVNVLVIAPYDALALTGVVEEAHKAGIKVISYDRLIADANVDLYLSFDNEKVGQFEAQYVVDALKDKLGKGTKLKVAYVGGAATDNNAKLLREGSFKVLQPLVDSGKIEIVMDKLTPKWDPDTAYKNVKTYLDGSKGAIDAVVAANDGTAGGAIKALAEYHLDGKVPVSGQDAELAACRRVIKGTQTVTVYKSISKLAAAGIDLAVKLANGSEVQSNAKVSDGKNDIQSVLLEPIPVTKTNMESTIIKDGYHKYDEVYKN
jgi:D-xylose transport system substrate-binding protein